MQVLLTGGSGIAGRFITEALTGAGHDVTHLGRTPVERGVFAREPAFLSWSLEEQTPCPPRADALVHAAFDHVPGAYRGGEGDDPDRFWRLNHTGSVALFAAAVAAGVTRIVFVSSRAVYGDHRRGEILRETDAPAPDSLYGRMKLATEQALGSRWPGQATILRPTGIYGCPPGRKDHKWLDLFDDYACGCRIAPRVGGEVHGIDLGAAVLTVLDAPGSGDSGVFNVADLVLDRCDLLTRVQAITGSRNAPPPRYQGPLPGIMESGRLAALGWVPGGFARLDRFLAECVAAPAF